MRNKKRSNPNFATEEKVMKALLIIALPIILSNILQGVLEIVDMHFIGALGNDAISGCGIASSVLMVLMVVNFGVNTATAAFASRAYGSKNYERVKVIMMHSLYMVLIFSAVIAFIGMFFSKNIMYLMGADEAVAVQGALFLKPLLMGVCVMVVLMILVTVFQSTGDSRTPMIVMIFVNIVNIILNPTFIHTLGFGVSGSAYATIASRSFGILMMLFAMYVVKKDSPVKFPRKLTFEPHLLKDVVIVAIPAAIQSGIRSASLLLMTAVITYAYGTIAMAAFGICGRLDMLGFMIVMGICTGVS
ncbi:MAG TPA: MATE family efflux transporter, partial [Methanocorpusculum sp.]|nr:MATE family efflux transporter [Methanocorpusculum sp.]